MIRGDIAAAAAYRRGAALARAHRIVSDADLGRFVDAPPPDVDHHVIGRLQQVHATGAWVLLESTLADVPADLRWLFESGAVTLDGLAALHNTLGVTTAADLAAAVNEHAIRGVLGEHIEAAIASALPSLRRSIRRVPLGSATAIAEPLLEELRAMRGVAWAEPVGSLRRGQDLIGDIEIVASAANPDAAIDAVVARAGGARCLHRSDRRVYFRADRVQVGVRIPEESHAAATLLYLTGTPRHVSALQRYAGVRGWRLTTTGLHAPDGALLPAPTEADIYRALDLPCIPPEIRAGEDEIAAAAAGQLPELVAVDYIRGDLHMHSTWSDGRDSIEAMVAACRDLGYEYLAITDHSPHSAAVRSLTVDGVQRQAEEICALRERFPDIAILHGCEVDILPDGRLDLPDRVLEQLDIVLASLHEPAGQGPSGLMKRYETAMRHPLVSLITHPTNRMVPHRKGYDLDYDRLFALAVDTATIVEIDGAPAHLDLDGALARRAVAAGATLAIDSDGHRADLLRRQMRLGITTARRGWVEPRHVLNTRSLADVRAFIARKRASR